MTNSTPAKVVLATRLMWIFWAAGVVYTGTGLYRAVQLALPGIGRLALLAGYLAIAVGLALVAWRVTRGIFSRWRRHCLRAIMLAFLFAPGVVACGGASIVPFSLVVMGDIVGFIAPNGCGPYTPLNLVYFLPSLAMAVMTLYLLERRWSRVVVLAGVDT